MTESQRFGGKTLVLYACLEEFLRPWPDQKARLEDLISYVTIWMKESKASEYYPHLAPSGEDIPKILDEFGGSFTQAKSRTSKSIMVDITGRKPVTDVPSDQLNDLMSLLELIKTVYGPKYAEECKYKVSVPEQVRKGEEQASTYFQGAPTSSVPGTTMTPPTTTPTYSFGKGFAPRAAMTPNSHSGGKSG